MTLAAYAGVAVQGWTGSLLVGAAAGIVSSGLRVGRVLWRWCSGTFRGRALVAPLIASIGLAFLLRSVLTFAVGFEQQSFQVPICAGAGMGRRAGPAAGPLAHGVFGGDAGAGVWGCCS